jgi:Flp pilus assembly protein TadG
MNRWIRQFASTEAAEIAEAALVLPLLFTFILGIIWFGRAFNIYSTIAHAAQEGAITAARPTCATCGNGFPANGTVETAVLDVLAASSLDRTQILAPSPALAPTACPAPYPTTPQCNTTSNNITICRAALLNPQANSGPAQCGTIVSFRYPFQLPIPLTSTNSVVMTAEAQSRMEN